MKRVQADTKIKEENLKNVYLCQHPSHLQYIDSVSLFCNIVVLQTFVCKAFRLLFVIFLDLTVVSPTTTHMGKKIGYCVATKTVAQFHQGRRVFICLR